MKSIFKAPKPASETGDCQADQIKSKKTEERKKNSKPKLPVAKSILPDEKDHSHDSSTAIGKKKKKTSTPSKPQKSLTDDEWHVLFSSVLSHSGEINDDFDLSKKSITIEKEKEKKYCNNDDVKRKEKSKASRESKSDWDLEFEKFEDQIDVWSENAPKPPAVQPVESNKIQSSNESGNFCELQPVHFGTNHTLSLKSPDKDISKCDSQVLTKYDSDEEESQEQKAVSKLQESCSKNEDKQQNSDDSDPGSDFEELEMELVDGEQVIKVIEASQPSQPITEKKSAINTDEYEPNFKKWKHSSKKNNNKSSGLSSHSEDRIKNKKKKGDKKLKLPKDFPAKKKNDHCEIPKQGKKKKANVGSQKNLQKYDYSDSDTSDDEPGTWVQCDKPGCHKWRHLLNVEDPALLPEEWFCNLNPDQRYNSCSKAQETIDESEHIYTKFTPGSIVWAKMAGYPWWPAMIESDVDFKTYFELKREDGMHPIAYHVSFFDDCVSRAWIRTAWICPYNGSARPKNFSHHGYKKDIEIAENNAKNALELGLKERLAKYGFTARYSKKKSKKSKFSKFDEFDIVRIVTEGDEEMDKKNTQKRKKKNAKGMRPVSERAITLKAKKKDKKEKFDPDIFTMEASAPISGEAELPEDSAAYSQSEEENSREEEQSEMEAKEKEKDKYAQDNKQDNKSTSKQNEKCDNEVEMESIENCEEKKVIENNIENCVNKSSHDQNLSNKEGRNDKNNADKKLSEIEECELDKDEKSNSSSEQNCQKKKSCKKNKGIKIDIDMKNENSNKEKISTDKSLSDTETNLVSEKDVLPNNSFSENNELVKKDKIKKLSMEKNFVKSEKNKTETVSSEDEDWDDTTKKSNRKIKVTKKRKASLKSDTDESDDDSSEVNVSKEMSNKKTESSNQDRSNSEKCLSKDVPKKKKLNLSRDKKDNTSEIDESKETPNRITESRAKDNGKSDKSLSKDLTKKKKKKISKDISDNDTSEVKESKETSNKKNESNNMDKSNSEKSLKINLTKKEKLNISENLSHDNKGNKLDDLSGKITSQKGQNELEKYPNDDKQKKRKLSLNEKSSSSSSDGVVPEIPKGDIDTKIVKKGKYARALPLKQKTEDQSVPELDQNIEELEIEEEEIKPISIKKVTDVSDAESECLDLEENSTMPGRRSDGESDCDSDILDLEESGSKCVVEVNKSAEISDNIHGRFAGRCVERDSDSDPFDLIED